MEVRISLEDYLPFVAAESAGPPGVGEGELITVGNSPPMCTGAGKSSLILAMLRIVEIDSGKIFIDGIDCKELGLFDLVC